METEFPRGSYHRKAGVHPTPAVIRRGALLCTVIGLSACAGLTQMQDAASKFDQGVHTASTAELSLFDQVRAAECNQILFRSGFDFATAVRNKSTGTYEPDVALDLRAADCVNQELTNDELTIRQNILSTITLYADTIQTLTNGTSDSTLSTNAKALATNIQALGTQQKFTTPVAEGAAALNAAITTLAAMILDHSAYAHVKDAAAAMQAPLTTVVEALKSENTSDMVGLASKADGLLNELKTSLDSARDNAGPASFIDIVFSRQAAQSLIVAAPDVRSLNNTLDSIVKANEALSRSTQGGAIPEINDLISRAQQAQTLFSAAK